MIIEKWTSPEVEGRFGPSQDFVREEQGPNVLIPLNALEKRIRRTLVIFNLYSNFCTSLVWRGWSRMVCIFYMSRIILKKKKIEK